VSGNGGNGSNGGVLRLFNIATGVATTVIGSAGGTTSTSTAGTKGLAQSSL